MDNRRRLIEFLDRIGGIPENNQSWQYRQINETLTQYFSTMTIDEILEVLLLELQKRPNGRVLKLVGFCWLQKWQLDAAITAFKLALPITVEDPVAIYEDLGRCYVVKGDLETARFWFSHSYRYDFDFLLSLLGPEYLFVTAVGNIRRRPPVFGEDFDDFSAKTTALEFMADAMSIQFGNKRGHKSLAAMQIEPMLQNMAREYGKDPQKVVRDIMLIRASVSKLMGQLAMEIKVPAEEGGEEGAEGLEDDADGYWDEEADDEEPWDDEDYWSDDAEDEDESLL